MAVNKGKTGGRKINQTVLIRSCEDCGKSSEDVIRVKRATGTGKSRMMWTCKKGCE